MQRANCFKIIRAMLYEELSTEMFSKKKISIEAACREKEFKEEGGMSINFYKECPNPPDTNRDILFHFNPRPPNKLILNTCINGTWQDGMVLINDAFKTTLFQTPFKLTIEPIDHEGEEKNEFEFKVSLNDKLLTWYLCSFDIRETTHLGYSPCLCIQRIQ